MCSLLEQAGKERERVKEREKGEPYTRIPDRDLLSGSSMRPYHSLTFEESIDILHLLLFRRPPLWALLYLPLLVFLQVPGLPSKYVTNASFAHQDFTNLSKHSRHKRGEEATSISQD